MHGVKCIIEPLQLFTVMPLLPCIQPDWDQCQQSNPLSCDKMCLTKQVNFISKSFEYFKVDIPHTDQLSQIFPPLFATEEIERQRHKNASMIIIYKGNDSAKIRNTDRCNSNGYSFPNLLFFCCFIPMNQTYGYQKRILQESCKYRFKRF